MSERAPRRPETCVGAVIVDDGSLLLVKRGRAPAVGRWSVPGGRVDWGETLQEAVVREVAEETGLDVVCADYLGFVQRIADEAHVVIHDFRAVITDRRPPVAGDDADDVAWVRLADLADVDLVDGLFEFLADHGVTDTIV